MSMAFRDPVAKTKIRKIKIKQYKMSKTRNKESTNVCTMQMSISMFIYRRHRLLRNAIFGVKVQNKELQNALLFQPSSRVANRGCASLHWPSARHFVTIHLYEKCVIFRVFLGRRVCEGHGRAQKDLRAGFY